MNSLEKFSHFQPKITSEFLETSEVFPGVVCDVYIHPDTKERDLGIITISPGIKTKPQRVLSGELTIEGYLSGKGTLTVSHADGSQSIMSVDPSAEGFCYSVEVGDIMQWQAAPDSELYVFEVCFPPYQDGRYENLEEE